MPRSSESLRHIRANRAIVFAVLLLAGGLAAPVSDNVVPNATAQDRNPDLSLEDITMSTKDRFPNAGETITITARMVNQDPVSPLPSGREFRILLEDRTGGVSRTRCVAFTTTSEWAPQATLTRTFTYAISSAARVGDHRILMTINKNCGNLDDGTRDTYTPVAENSVIGTPRLDNNQRHFAIVVNQKPDLQVSGIQWCEAGSNPPCTEYTTASRPSTPYSSAADPNHRFRFVLTNVGYNNTGRIAIPMTDPAHSASTATPGSGQTTFTDALVPVRVSVVQASNGTVMRTTWVNITNFSDPLYTPNLPLLGMAGKYDIVVEADPAKIYPDRNRTANRGNTTIAVKGVDLVAGHNNAVLRTEPYSVVDNVTLQFMVTNTGEVETPSGRLPIPMNLFYDGSKSVSHANVTDIEYLDANETRVVNVTIRLVATLEEERVDEAKVFAGGGRHSFSLHVDGGNGITVGQTQKIYESNESNNVATAIIIVNDTLSPVITNVVTTNPPTYPDEPGREVYRLAEFIHFKATVADNDPTLDDVWLNVTLPDGNTTRHNMKRVNPSADQWEYVATNGFDLAGTYAYVVCARDPAQNPIKCANGPAFDVTPWPKRIEFLTDRNSIDRTTNGSAHARIGPTSTDSTPWTVPLIFKQEDWQVGFPGGRAGNNSTGKAIKIWQPGTTPGSVEYYEYGTDGSDILAYGSCPAEGPCTDRFVYGGRFAFGTPGPLHMILETKDRVGACECLHWFLWLADMPPKVNGAPLLEPRTGRTGDRLTWHYNVSDSTVLAETDVTAVHLNVTIPGMDGWHLNKTLSRVKQTREIEDGLENVRTYASEWNLTLTAGRGFDLPFAGGRYTYNTTVAMLDKWGNWGHRYTNLTIIDDVAPVIIDARVSSLKEEAGKKLNFTVRATDNAQLTATVRVSRADTGAIVLNHTKMNGPLDGDTFWYEAAFNDSGVYNYEFEVTDGTFSQTSVKKSFEVSKNLEPRVRFDNFVRRNDTRYYASATPRAEIIVYDSEGVLRDSMKVYVDGNEVGDWSAVPVTQPGNGFRIYYNFSSFSLRHGDVVNLSVSALDASPQALGLSTDQSRFEFVVDATPPKTTLTRFLPQYLPNVTDNFFVSPRTAFTVAASDAGSVEKTFILLGKGGNKEIREYTGTPILMNEFTTVCCRPGVYTVQFWSRDDVGNEESRIVGGPNEVIVQLDDTPPRVGRDDVVTPPFINVTISDSESGVKEAFLLVEVETPGVGRKTLPPITMRYEEPWWRGKLPDDAATVPRGSVVHYSIDAVDNVDNKQVYEYPAWATGNRAPVVKFTAPTNGAAVTGKVTFRWQASDPDGDRVSVVLEHKPPGASVYQVIYETDTSTLFDIDASRLPNGVHSFRLTATDNNNASQAATLSLTVKNEHEPVTITPVKGQEVRPGDLVYVFARVNRPATTVKGILYHNGEMVGVVIMRDDGDEANSGDKVAGDGLYTGGFELTRAGKHEIVIETEYSEGGETKKYRTAGEDLNFDVQYTPTDVINRNPGLWGAIGFLTLAVVGVGVFAIARRKGGA